LKEQEAIVTEIKNNPAGRLLDILSEARLKKETTRVRTVWSEVFEIDDNDTGELLRMIAGVIDLIHDTKSSIDRVSNIDHDLYKRPFLKIERSLSRMNFDSQWKACKDDLDDSTLLGLRFCADQLERASAFTAASEIDLKEIIEDLAGLSEKVYGSDITDELKLLLIKNLEDVRRAILAYRITGLDGIDYQVERSLGSIILHKGEILKSRSDQEAKGVWDSYFRVLDKLHKIVSVARDTKELVGPAIRMLGLDGG
jgi:hypothetical protein